jgi:hypothetical protein
VAQEPEVREAAVRWDRATPSTHRDLVRARLAAQARLGIPAAERAPLYSGEVEDFLVPVMIRMGRGEEGAVVVELRKALMRLYGDSASPESSISVCEEPIWYIPNLSEEEPLFSASTSSLGCAFVMPYPCGEMVLTRSSASRGPPACRRHAR